MFTRGYGGISPQKVYLPSLAATRAYKPPLENKIEMLGAVGDLLYNLPNSSPAEDPCCMPPLLHPHSNPTEMLQFTRGSEN